ncbi:aryl-alcohol-oxidase from pleurotus Eryingii [Roridomyces roridus]|uniref:Aryl-alcohol-oxidase from pleurotus Eryingii n=1 Tax=Roridomyces roridus TaxID=1738132 RepID=A0AAD7BLJ1_9AGAR|nr:aryl-alcohol-oxidase from pleurotus Eryingii [Roridomyces roridus]
MSLSNRLIPVVLAAAAVVNAKLYTAMAQLPGLNYDFVIIGGGAAGNVVANRLTENPNFQVLVIEAGPSNEGILEEQVPALALNLYAEDSPYLWPYMTTPQVGANNASQRFLRGRILGGGTGVNEMFYSRGSSDDFDRYANVSGDQGWSWDAMLPYFLKNEKWVAPADHHNETGQFDPKFHNFTGMNSVSLAGYQWPMFSRVIQTTQEMPDEFPFNLDYNSGNTIGVGWVQYTIGNGTRSSSASSCLGPQFMNRTNLHVLVNTQVSRVLPATSGKGKTPHFNRVEFSQDLKSALFVATASKEVILSAGAIGTPHILMNSGIGDKKTLTKLGIKSLIDLPSVGQNFTEQPLVPNSWFANSTDTYENFNNETQLDIDLAMWNQSRTGPLVSPIGQHLAFLRFPKENSSIFETREDPSAGPNTGHYELEIANGIGLLTPIPAGGGHFISVQTVCAAPASRGSVTLNTTHPSPFNSPLIDPALLMDSYDLFALKVAIQQAVKFLSADAWQGYVLEPLDDLAQALTSDEALEAYIRQTVVANEHPVGTAAMSPKNADWGVVDPDLLMKKATGLRIIDASIMPYVPSGHSQAPTYAVAERGADLVKATWA